ncbi:hypothetical protein JCM11251_007719 [Rhodosporidiobolus azoricus]
MVATHRRKARRLCTTALLAATTLLLPSFTSASFLSSSFDSLRARALLPRAETGTVIATDNSTVATGSSSPPVVVSATSHEGRYGHQAVYLPPPSNELFLLGGQLDANGTVPSITPSNLNFRLASTFLWGDRPVSAIPDNPSVDSALSTGLPASAWGAAAADAQGRTWLFGGVTADCETDSVANVYSNGTWTGVQFEPRMPPRRRQASAIPVANSTTGGTDVWVFGGIAEQSTCSSIEGGTVAYAGMDRYDTANEVVESMAWSAPEGAGQGWLAPVSDYTATLLEEGKILVVGGQNAQGTLAHLDEVLLFDIVSRSWTSQVVYGPTPPSRMGHTSVLLPSGSLLVHGGLSATHGPLSDVYLLQPSSTNSSWIWSEVVISSSSLLSPSLAWHTANLVAGETIVVAFGIDATTATPSSDFWFLTIDEEEGTYSWKDTWEGNANALGGESAEALAKRALDVIVNPKASLFMDESSTASPAETQPAYYGGGGGYAGNGEQGAEPVGSSRPAYSSSSRITPSPSASPVRQSASSDDDPSSDKKTTAIAASIGAIGGAVALVGLAFFALRRRAAKQAQAAYAGMGSPMMGHTPEGARGAGGLRPVSTLLYTRPVQKRMMSLGSTISPMPTPRFPEDDLLNSGTENMAGVGSAAAGAAGGLGASPDPFSDDHKVNELGQLERAGSSASAGSTGGVVGTATSALKASVQSIPFLSSIAQTASPKDGDVYTSPAPTLTAKRSLRRPAQVLPPLPQTSPVPQTPAELIGLAVTSDDGHTPISALDAVEVVEGEGLPYLQAEKKDTEPWARLVEKTPTLPAGAAPPNLANAAGLPLSLRPGTPLRIANPDPFVDPPQQ